MLLKLRRDVAVTASGRNFSSIVGGITLPLSHILMASISISLYLSITSSLILFR